MNVPTEGSADGASRRVLVMPRMFSSTSSGVPAVSENAGTLAARSPTVNSLFFGERLARIGGDRDRRSSAAKSRGVARSPRFPRGPPARARAAAAETAMIVDMTAEAVGTAARREMRISLRIIGGPPQSVVMLAARGAWATPSRLRKKTSEGYPATLRAASPCAARVLEIRERLQRIAELRADARHVQRAGRCDDSFCSAKRIRRHAGLDFDRRARAAPSRDPRRSPGR